MLCLVAYELRLHRPTLTDYQQVAEHPDRTGDGITHYLLGKGSSPDGQL
jgi:hypothetical protein